MLRQNAGHGVEAITALHASGECVGLEVGLQLVGARHRDGAIRGDILQTVGKRSGDISRPDFVPAIEARLEQIGATTAETAGDAEVESRTTERDSRRA